MEIIFILLFVIGLVYFVYYWCIYKLLLWIFEPIIDYLKAKDKEDY